MTIYILLYLAILFAIGIYDSQKIKTFEDYAVAGKNQSLCLVVMSLMATMIGASATLGIIERSAIIGFPAIWWLIVGALGLIMQGIFLSKKIRSMNAITLPNLVEKYVGRKGGFLTSLIIIIAWPGIIASQFVAMSTILMYATGRNDNKIMLIIVALIVISYTIFGGQLSVIKTDTLQFIVIAVSFVLVFVYLFFFAEGNTEKTLSNIQLLNDSYTALDFIIQLLIVGGTYLLGPDVISRNLVSKNEKTAKKATFISASLLIIFSIIIVLIGLFIVTNEHIPADENPLYYIMENVLPKPIAILLALGLLSTLLSTSDTCLVNISSIVEKDILKRDKVWEARAFAALFGLIALMIAFTSGDIIEKLTGAYSIYAPGIVCPLFIAIICNEKKSINTTLWLIAVVTGGACGAFSTYAPYIFTNLNENTFVTTYLPVVGMALSLILSLCSMKKSKI